MPEQQVRGRWLIAGRISQQARVDSQRSCPKEQLHIGTAQAACSRGKPACQAAAGQGSLTCPLAVDVVHMLHAHEVNRYARQPQRLLPCWLTIDVVHGMQVAQLEAAEQAPFHRAIDLRRGGPSQTLG